MLIVEDAPEFAQMVSAVVRNAGHEIRVATTAADARNQLLAVPPDLVVLDLSLPDGDGLDLARHIRDHSSAYILMLTARADEVDKLVGFKLGADDYMTKPFSPRELDARIEALLRRQRSTGPAQANRREIGAITIDVAAREVAVDGVPVELTRIEFELLNMFTGSPKVVFSRQQLLDRVWGPDWYADDHVVDVHIANLRKKVDREGEPSVIRTVRSVSYGFRG